MKIKKVEIQAFKTYLHRQNGTFDFMTDEGVPASLISIYAPNGFGKTAFYDAVDYCMTNNVNRYIRGDRILKQNKEYGKNINKSGEIHYILRNRIVDDLYPELKTEVKLETTVDTFTSNYKKPKKGYMDYRFDPSDTPTDRMYFSEIMLTQENIDSFLREDSPFDRFRKFIDNQNDELKGLNDKRLKIHRMLKDVANKKSEFETKRAEIKKKIEDIDVQKDVFIEANRIVNKFSGLGFDLVAIENPFSLVGKQHLFDKIKTVKVSLSDNEKECMKSNGIVVSFQNNLDLVFSFYKVKNQLVAELDEIEKAVKNKRITDVRRKVLSNTSIEVEEVIGAIKLIDGHIKHLPEYVNHLKEINRVEVSIDEQEKKLSSIAVSESQCSKSISVKNENIESLKVKDEGWKSLLVSSGEIYKILYELKQEKKDLLEKINSEGDIKGFCEKNIENIKKELDGVKQFSIDKITPGKSDVEEINSLNELHKDHIKEKEISLTHSNKLKALNSELNNITVQSKAVSELIRAGSEIISKSTTSDCPLCLATYSSYEQLHDRIKNNPALDEAEKNLVGQISDTEVLLGLSKKKLSSLYSGFKDTCEKLARNLKDRLIIETSSLATSVDSSEKYTLACKRIDEKVIQNNEKVFYKTSDDLVIHIKNEISSVEERNINYKAERNKYEEELKVIQKSRIDISTVLSLSKSKRGLLLKVNDFDQLLTFMKLNSIDNANVVDLESEVLGLYENSKNRLKEKKLEVEMIGLELEGLIDVVPARLRTVDLESIKEILESKQDELSKISEKLMPYQGAISLLDVRKLLDEGGSASILEKCGAFISVGEKSLRLNESRRSEIELLLELGEDALNFSDKIEFERQHDSFVEKISRIDSIDNQLSNDLKTISKFLEDSIKGYFHTDLINQIYSAIDPHPDFKEIKFDCNIPESGGRSDAELNITLKSPSDDSVISPNLHFSAAQINVLSLSIFLARALNATDNSNAPVDCIFIDDPIQSMDSINVLSLIDLFRNLTSKFNKQLIISTHDQNFHELLRKKIPKSMYNSKFFKLESFGRVVLD